MDVMGEWWKRKRRGNKFSSEDEPKKKREKEKVGERKKSNAFVPILSGVTN
jgi:hypothetical protein